MQCSMVTNLIGNNSQFQGSPYIIQHTRLTHRILLSQMGTLAQSGIGLDSTLTGGPFRKRGKRPPAF